jgi:hypothetical protein
VRHDEHTERTHTCSDRQGGMSIHLLSRCNSPPGRCSVAQHTHAHAPGRSLSPLTTTGLRVISRGRAGNLQRGQKLEAAMAMRMHSLQN